MTKLDHELLKQIKTQIAVEVDARIGSWLQEHSYVVVKAKTAPLLTRLRYWWRHVTQAPRIAWAKRRYSKMDQAERNQVDDAYLALVLRVLRRTVPTVGRSYKHVAGVKPPHGTPSSRSIRGVTGPPDERVRNEDFVQYLLEGTEWQAQPKTAEDGDNLGSVEIKTPPKE